jgi:hypothetical protein
MASEQEEAVSIDSSESPAFVVRPPQVEQPPMVNDAGAPGHVTRAATAEEMRAVEALFRQQATASEPPSVAGLFFAYSAGMVLHDILKDTFTPETREVEVEEEPRKKKEPE